MERERFTRLLKDPGEVARKDLDGLKALAGNYPWFSGAHLLLALGEHAADDVMFDERLREAAAHVPSRAILFDHAGPFSQDLLPADGAPPAHAPRGAHPLGSPEPVSRWAPPFPPPPLEAVPESGSTVIESGPEELPPVDTLPSPQTQPAPPAADPDPLEEQILEAALASGYSLLLEQGPAESPTPQQEPISEAAPDSSPAEHVEALEPETAPALVMPISGRMSFSAWLSLGERTVTPPSSTEHTPPVGVAEEPAMTAAPGKTDRETTLDTKALIDRFIEQQSPPPPRKAEFFTPQQAAKRSLQEQADLVTETLARIHEQQGNLAKAADAYRKLALKHPEKSAYFAALAKKLEARSGK